MNIAGPVTVDHEKLTAAVFISYATPDRKEALSVCKAIERRGLNCWISTRDVAPGDNYQEAIVRALRDSRAMVLVFSEAANNSDEIKKELSLASRYHIPVMALRIEDVEPSDAFAYELSTRQWIDAFEGWDRSIDAVVDCVGGMREMASSAAAPQARTPKRRWTRHPQLLIATAAIALVIIGGLLWLLRDRPVAAHTMQVRLAGFERLSSDLPATLPQALADELDAAFNKDGVITVSRAAAAPPGTAPAYAISGTILHEGDKVKVITHLVNERSGTTLWTNEHAFDATSLAHIPRWAAVNSSFAVRCGLFGISTYPKTLSDQTVATYLQFCSEPSPTKSLDLAHKVVAAAPDFSWGWSAVEQSALGSSFQEQPGPARERLRKEAIAAADKATRLDRSNSEAYAYKSYLLDPGDFVGREQLLKEGIAARALACGCEHHLYGNFLVSVGRIRDAVEEFQRATDVLPQNGSTQIALADALVLAGYPEQSTQAYDAAVDLVDHPELPDEIRIMSAPLNGNYANLDSAIHNPKIKIPAALVQATASAFKAMNSADAQAKRKAAAALVALPQDIRANRLTITLLGALGDNADALKELVEARRRGDSDATSWLFFPSMAGAIRDPGFLPVAQQLGLMRYWKTSRTKPDICNAHDAPGFCRII